MPTILAHRGNINGPSATDESRGPAIAAALQRGWGLELDIRRTRDGQFYVSHDPQSAPDCADALAIVADIAAHPQATLALNIKELGYERELLDFLERHGVLAQTVLFDMELIEPVPGQTAQRFRQLHPTVRLAARVSDRHESLERALAIAPASVIWLDEFDRHWSTSDDVRRLKAAGKMILAVSPDLHRYPLERARARWQDFCAWGVDAICTDYCADLETMMTTSLQRATA